MLETAKAAHQSGADVVVGLVHSGGRSSIERLVWNVYDYECWKDIELVIASGINVWAALDATGFSSWSSVVGGGRSRTSGLSLL